MSELAGTDVEWEKWGAKDPYYGVLTQDRFRRGALDDQARRDFFDSGRTHADHVLATCRARLQPEFLPHRILDFGCGVGRVTIAFSKMAEEVVGVDVSQAMLDEARANCESFGVGNVRFLRSDDLLADVGSDFDLVHSCIVLQHVEVPRGRRLFSRLVDCIRPGGAGALHVTYGVAAYVQRYGQPVVIPRQARAVEPRGLRSALRRAFDRSDRRSDPAPDMRADEDPEMQMNYYNLSELSYVLHARGIGSMHVEFTDHGGALGAILYFRVPA
jgi:SAM-dependent methyltransferase